MTTCIMDTVVVFIFTYKNQFLVYLTKLNSIVKRLNIQHETYSKCLEIFLNNGNLDDVPTQIELEFSLIVGELGHDISESNQPEQPVGLLRKIDSSKILKLFDTSSNTSKEDWNQWMRKSSVELLKESPNLVLSPCH